jgi:hypothetical protein
MSESFLSLLQSILANPQNQTMNILKKISGENSTSQQFQKNTKPKNQAFYGSEGGVYTPQMIYARNKAWLNPAAGNNYQTVLPPAQEAKFRQWLVMNKVPFDPNQANPDYDMRGFWQALQQGNPMAKSAVDPNDGQIHYPDYWKTPYDLTFSNESKFANPKTAPSWNNNNELVLPNGQIVWNDSLPSMRQLIRSVPTLAELQVKLNPSQTSISNRPTPVVQENTPTEVATSLPLPPPTPPISKVP